MLSTGWRKALRDLWLNKTRTILVVLAMTIGIFAVGSVLSAYAILTREINRNYLETNPASAIFLLDAVDKELTTAVTALPEVAQAEARGKVDARIEVAPNEWLSIRLFVIEDFNALRVNTFTPERGATVPAEGELLIERTALSLLQRDLGEVVIVKSPNGSPQPLTITGLVHDPGQAPAWMEGFAYGYITPQTLAELGEEPLFNFNELRVLMAGKADNQESNRVAAHQLREWLQSNGIVAKQVIVPVPGEHPHHNQMQSLLFLLEAFALLALLLSGVLVTTVISAFMGQQLRQIGIMKAMGAKTTQIAAIYFGAVIVLATVALIIGMPTGIWAGRAYAEFAAWMLNFEIGSDKIELWVYLIQVVAALLISLLSAAYPIYKGSRFTVRQALSETGVRVNAFGTRPIDSLLKRIQGVRRTLLFSLRNTFRRQGRILLTLLTLAAGGAVFMTAINIGDSWQQTIESALEARRYDILFAFTQPVAAEQLQSVIGSVPGVKEVEAWGATTAIVDQAGSYGDEFQLLAPPATTTMIDYPLIAGRWLEAGDENALVLNHSLVAHEPELVVGSQVLLQLNGEQSAWQIVGIVREVGAPKRAYTNLATLSALTKEQGYANRALVASQAHEPAAQATVRRELEQALQQANINVAASETVAAQYQSLLDHIVIIINFLILMAILVAAVGGLGLMSTMSLNVLERRREIGIMRAMGATSLIVLQLILTEGIFIGLLSWLLAILFTLPLTNLVGNIAGQLFINAPLTISYSPLAIALWLLLTLLLATIASTIPARQATQLPVYQALAYE